MFQQSQKWISEVSVLFIETDTESTLKHLYHAAAGSSNLLFREVITGTNFGISLWNFRNINYK